MKYLKLFILMLFLITISLNFVSAETQTLGTFKLNDCVELKQTCANCTYVNVSSVVYPNSTIALMDFALIKRSSTEFNETYCNTSVLGQYIVNGYADPDGVGTLFAYDFFITPTGEDTMGLVSLGFIIGAIVIAGLLFLASTFFAKEQVGIKTLLMIFGFGFLILTAQISKIAIAGRIWLEDMAQVGLTMTIVLFWFMISYYFIIYTKVIIMKLRDFKQAKKDRRYGNWA